MQEEVYEASEIIEETPIIEESGDEIIEVEIFEAFQAPTADDSFNHALLTNREIHDAHPITAITGLREELDSIEALQTVYSDKKGNADYYEWADGLAIADAGYFVTLNNDARITICTGDDIFGVVVDGAAFVGGQDDVVRDARYGLVATTGAVNVRCELDVVEGDYVISNAYGTATKSTSECGYRVVALHNINGVPHATINLNISADQVHLMGAELQKLDSRMGAAETNIVSAINVANQAHKQASEAAVSSSVSEEAVKEALESILNSEEQIKKFETTVGSVSHTSAQAKAIAESAVTSAMSIKTEAMGRANEAWAKADEVQKEAYSLCAKIDKHSVGEYSQAYGLTLEQAKSILEIGMIYVPTSHKDSRTHTEEYLYDVDGETKTYERTFTPGYLYEWNEIPDSEIGVGWVTVDKNYHGTTEADADETNPINTSAMAVYFSAIEVAVGDNNNYAYWYTTSEDILDSAGKPTDKYQPYTLYHWEDTHWVAVATLKGNVSNRMVSEVYQTTNEITLGVSNTRGCIASLRTSLSDTESKVQDMTMWITGSDENGNALSYNLATIDRSANKDGSSIALAVADVNGNKVINGASITLNQDGSDSSVYIDASHIVLDGKTTFTSDDNGETRIDGGYIATNTITADKIEVKDLKSFGATIGNWAISKDEIYSGTSGLSANSNNSYMKDSLVTSEATSAVRFYCGHSNRVDGNFVVLDDGSLYAGAVKLGTGDLGSNNTIFLSTTNMSGVEGFFDGTSINNWRLTVGSNFGVTSDGSLYAEKGYIGSDFEIRGTITAEKISSFTHREYNNVGEIIYTPSSIGDTLEMTMRHDNTENSSRVGVSMGNGTAYDDEGLPDAYLEVVGTNALSQVACGGTGRVAIYGSKAIDLSTRDGAIKLNGLTIEPNGTDHMITSRIYATDARFFGLVEMYNGEYQSWRVTSGTMDQEFLSFEYDLEKVAHIWNDKTNKYVHLHGVANHGLKLYGEKTNYLNGTWQLDSGATVTSDRNYKNSVDSVPEKYGIFFDNLQPVVYKYNDGQSNRLHTGFIAQEVDEALTMAELTRQDFAGVCIVDEGTENELWSLRYTEFVPLNTYEIQKLKSRVAELEATVVDLKAKLD